MWLSHCSSFFALERFEKIVIKPRGEAPEQVLFSFHLAGLSVNSGTMLLPSYAFPPQDLNMLKEALLAD